MKLRKNAKSSETASDEKYFNAPKMPVFTFNREGRISDIWTKSAGWRPIREVNIYFLNKCLQAIEANGKKHSKCWYAVDQEIKRRDSAPHPKPLPLEAAVE